MNNARKAVKCILKCVKCDISTYQSELVPDAQCPRRDIDCHQYIPSESGTVITIC